MICLARSHDISGSGMLIWCVFMHGRSLPDLTICALNVSCSFGRRAFMKGSMAYAGMKSLGFWAWFPLGWYLLHGMFCIALM